LYEKIAAMHPENTLYTAVSIHHIYSLEGDFPEVPQVALQLSSSLAVCLHSALTTVCRMYSLFHAMISLIVLYKLGRQAVKVWKPMSATFPLPPSTK
jgi:hypothetical protein